ncbi:MAG: deoxyribonuclease IV, partial [Patescibacteria group bacterium]
AAGGLWHAGENGKKLGCEVIQIFSRPPQGGKPREITKEEQKKFKQAMLDNKIQDVYIHAPYFINLASGVARIRHGSISILRQELERGSLLGCRAMMFHPGSAKDVGREKGIEMVIDGLNKILAGYQGSCQLLIEISAGAGEIMGDSFEEIAAFIAGAKRGREIGVCFDTQHAFASGYDLRSKEAVNKTFQQFDKIIGLKKLVVSHCNDSMTGLGAKRDRHEHLGKGLIGEEGFRQIVKHPKLQKIDLILETPHDDSKKINPRLRDMKLIKSFRK